MIADANHPSSTPLTVCANACMMTPALALGRPTAAATALAAACDWPCSTSSNVSIWYRYMYTESKEHEVTWDQSQGVSSLQSMYTLHICASCKEHKAKFAPATFATTALTRAAALVSADAMPVASLLAEA